MANIAQKNILLFSQIISGLLIALGKAQLDATMFVLHFLMSDAIVDPATNVLKNITLKNIVNGQENEVVVPILSLLKLPFMKINSSEMEFNISINSIEGASQSTPGTAPFDSSFLAHFVKQDIKNGMETNEKFDIGVKLKIEMDEIPDILKDAIDSLMSEVIRRPE